MAYQRNQGVTENHLYLLFFLLHCHYTAQIFRPQRVMAIAQSSLQPRLMSIASPLSLDKEPESIHTRSPIISIFRENVKKIPQWLFHPTLFLFKFRKQGFPKHPFHRLPQGFSCHPEWISPWYLPPIPNPFPPLVAVLILPYTRGSWSQDPRPVRPSGE